MHKIRGCPARVSASQSYPSPKSKSFPTDSSSSTKARSPHCPADIEGDFFKAKTLLFPGFRCTPEYSAIVGSNLPYVEKRALIYQAEQLDSNRIYSTDDFDLIKRFHDLGVPQVVQMRGRVFDSFDYRRTRKVVASSDLDSSTRLGA